MLTPHEAMIADTKKVTDQLYLCPPIRMDEELIPLKDLGVGTIINTGNFDNETVVVSHGMKYFHPHWPHTGQKQPEWLWEQLRTFLLDALAQPETKIACHCIAGGQRSATTVYLALRLQGKTAEEAREMIDAVTTSEPTYAHFVEDWLAAREISPFPIAVG